eukprot:1181171-Heterocapsa_arctica.AAC.1
MGWDEPWGTVPPFSLLWVMGRVLGHRTPHRGLVSSWVLRRARDTELFVHGARPPMGGVGG